MSADAVEVLFRKLKVQASATVDNKSRPYLILLQHSFSFALRQKAALDTTETDEFAYQRAGLRTPSENALRDLEGGALWTRYLTEQMCQETDEIVWLQTTSRRAPIWLQSLPNVHVINASRNSFVGCDEQSKTSGAANMEDLNSIVQAVESFVVTSDDGSVRCGIVIDSVTPILQRHGIEQTTRLIKRLQMFLSTLLISVRVECLSAYDHTCLEELAEATLRIQGGEATLLRKGIRERDNVVREDLPYEIVVADEPGQSRRIRLLASIVEAKPSAKSVAETPSNDNKQAASSQQTHASKSRPRMELRLEEDQEGRLQKQPSDTNQTAPTAVESSTQPNIYMDDDDPEFDDYDEEDPDDDLDI